MIVEDKRRTAILLNAYDIGRKEMIPIAENISPRKLDYIVQKLKEVQVASLVSDSGTPVISDPGLAVIARCWQEGMEIDIIPGPSAITSSVAASGFPGNRFIFLGFLPRRRKRRKLFRELMSWKGVIVFFESPSRLVETLKDVLDILGDLEIFIAREMTKIHQEFFKGRVGEAIEHFNGEVMGEITVVMRKEE